VLLGMGRASLRRGAYVPPGTFGPHPSPSHQCVKCNDLLKTKPIPPTPARGLPKHCLPAALSKLPGLQAQLEREGRGLRACDQKN